MDDLMAVETREGNEKVITNKIERAKDQFLSTRSLYQGDNSSLMDRKLIPIKEIVVYDLEPKQIKDLEHLRMRQDGGSTLSNSSKDADGYSSTSSQEVMNIVDAVNCKDNRKMLVNSQTLQDVTPLGNSFSDSLSQQKLIPTFKPDLHQRSEIIDLGKEKIYRLKGMHYNQQFDPEFSIGLYLRQLNIAQNLEEEVELAEKWKLQVRYAYEKMNIKNSNNQNDDGCHNPHILEESKIQKEIQYRHVQLATIYDSDKFAKPNCIFVLRKKSKEEISAEPKDPVKKDFQIPTLTQDDTDVSQDSDSKGQLFSQSSPDQTLEDKSNSSDSSGSSDSESGSSSRSSVSSGKGLKNRDKKGSNFRNSTKSNSNRIEPTQILGKRPERKRASKDLIVMRQHHNQRVQRQKTEHHATGVQYQESYDNGSQSFSSNDNSSNSAYKSNSGAKEDKSHKTSSVQIQKVKKKKLLDHHKIPSKNQGNSRHHRVSTSEDSEIIQKKPSKKNKQDYDDFVKTNKNQDSREKPVHIPLKKAATNTSNKITIPIMPSTGSGTSKCGRYVINTTSQGNQPYIQCLKSIQIINSSKEQGTVFRNLQEFQNKIIDPLNNITGANPTSIRYKCTVTPSYVTIKCENCNIFSFWYRNKDQKLMKDILGMDGNKVKNSGQTQELHVNFFRSINQNHSMDKHGDITF